MKIAIDGYEANVRQRLGSGQVAFELLKNLEKLDKNNQYTILLPSKPLDDLPNARLGWEYKVLKPNKLWTMLALPFYLYHTKDKPDVIFSPTHYIPRFSLIKRVGMIFDLSYLYFPKMFLKDDLYKLTKWSKFSIERSQHIITISKSTKDDIQKNYKVDKKKITVAYPGYNAESFYPVKDLKRINQIKEKYKIEGDYIIYISTLQPRKNHLRLIEAMAKIDNCKLVIVGKIKGQGRKAWMFDKILAAPKEFGIEEKIIFTDFVADKELVYLLNGAKAFICPSLYEGFGIPVVDAMACGLPVIVSKVSSLPEVVADAGLLVDPYSVDQIEQAIRLITTDKKLWNKKHQESLKQAAKFSWKKMAKEVLEVLEQVGKKDES